MDGYFQPLQRKLGVVALMFACVFTAFWIRGQFQHDIVTLNWGQRSLWICSADRLLVSVTLHPDASVIEHEPLIQWEGVPLKKDVTLHYVVGSVTLPFLPKYRGQVFVYPDHFIVVPLTVLSAGLLFGKPRSQRVQTLPRIES